MTGTVRLGTASPGSQPTTAATLSQLEAIASRAAASHIDILLLPEAYIGGYPRGTAFGCVIGDRSAEGREEYAKYFEQAVDLGDTVGDGGAGAGQRWVKRELGDAEEQRGDGTRETLERIASESGVFIVVGCIERTGGSLYCSVVYVCPTQGMIGKRRKVMPTGTERLIWAQGCPSTLRAVSTIIRGTRINLAAAICWENYMPLLRQTLYAQNVNLYLAPTADNREAWMGLMRTIGVEGRCFVVSSNMCVRKDAAAATNGNPRRVGGGANGARSTMRRNSTLTEEGHEIALPQGNGPRASLRRNSTLTEEGHEIALPQGNGARASGRRNSTFTDEGHEIALPQGLGQTKRRRKSVFDTDGNEIVLCCDEDDEVTPATTESQFASHSTSKTATKTKSSTFLSRGGSSIVDPFGEVLAGPQWEDEDGLIYADVDFRDCIKGRLDLDAGGSYSRNDSFKLTVKGLDLDPLPY